MANKLEFTDPEGLGITNDVEFTGTSDVKQLRRFLKEL